MKKLTTALCLILAATCAAQTEPSHLKFKCDGTFKIVQFTDTHFKSGKKASKKAVECITSVVDEEDPDLVIFTGDQVYADGVENALHKLTRPLVERGIAFAAVFGNHDHQFDMTRPAMYDLMQSLTGCVMPPRGDAESPDYAIPVRSSDGTSVAEVLYCMDTHDKTAAFAVGGGYDWLTEEQIGWYRTNSQGYSARNGNRPVPSLLFIHIPLPEYKTAAEENPGLVYGNWREKRKEICCSAFNSGMFDALKERSDITGVFCGHDHDNDFLVPHDGILLAYGRYSGGKTVYNHLGKNGARVILLDEKYPSRIQTWLRLSDGTPLFPYTFPQDTW